MPKPSSEKPSPSLLKGKEMIDRTELIGSSPSRGDPRDLRRFIAAAGVLIVAVEAAEGIALPIARRIGRFPVWADFRTTYANYRRGLAMAALGQDGTPDAGPGMTNPSLPNPPASDALLEKGGE